MSKTEKMAIKIFFILFIVFLFIDLSCRGASNSSFLFTNKCPPESKQFLIKEVCDGDTISLKPGACKDRKLSKEKIRLLCIDAFETQQKPYEFSRNARELLSKLVLNKTVCIETDKENSDKYKRTLGYIFVDKIFVNEEILKSGYAILYCFPPNTKYISKLKQAQIHAKKNMLGIWEKQDYITETPAQFRQKNKYRKH